MRELFRSHLARRAGGGGQGRSSRVQGALGAALARDGPAVRPVTRLLELFDRGELKRYLTGQLADYQVEVNEGEVVLDALHRLQATQTGDLAIRWNCKAGKCGSCSMES